MSKSSRTRNAETSREAILKAAELVFARDGFSGARVDSIAELSTYNKSLIFQYFGDKLALYQAVVRRLRQENSAYLLGILRDFATQDLTLSNLRRFLENLIGGSFDYLLEHPNLRALLAWEVAESWDNLKGLEASAEEIEFNETFTDCLSRISKSGLLRPGLEPDFLINSAFGLCVNYLGNLPRYQAGAVNQSEELRNARQQLLSLLLDGALSS